MFLRTDILMLRLPWVKSEGSRVDIIDTSWQPCYSPDTGPAVVGTVALFRQRCRLRGTITTVDVFWDWNSQGDVCARLEWLEGRQRIVDWYVTCRAYNIMLRIDFNTNNHQSTEKVAERKFSEL